MSKPIYQLDNIASNIFCVLFLFSILSMTVISNLPTSATDNTTAEDTVTITVQSACTLSGTGNSHTTTLTPGLWTPDIGASVMTVICNDSGGYSIYATGFSGNSYDPNTNTKLSATVGANTYTIPTSNYTANPSSSFWSMKLTQGTGDQATIISPYANYSAVPSTFTKVATYPSTTAGTSGSSFTTTYGVYPSLDQAAGTYTGQVKYVLVHPSSATPGTYTIAYNANGGSGTMNNSTGIYTFDEFTLPNSTLSAPSGYKFIGWCDTQDQTQSPQTTCSGTSYTDGDTIPAGTISTNQTLNLYAVWGISRDISTATYLQEVTICPSSLPVNTTATLKDSRDEQEYNVAKLADGKCWMVESLNLAGSTALDSDGSDVPPGYTQSNPYYTLPESSTYGFYENSVAYVYNSGNKTNTCSSRLGGCYSYYSWLAATAGGKDSSGNSVVTDGHNATYSICPKGWKLPTATTSNASATSDYNWKTGDLYALATAYGANLENNYVQNTNTFYTNAGPNTTPNFLLAGFYNSDTINNAGMVGGYWSSTAYSSEGSYDLAVYSSRVDAPGANLTRKSGYHVRCIFAGE